MIFQIGSKNKTRVIAAKFSIFNFQFSFKNKYRLTTLSGFTLIELMLVVSLLVLFVGLTAPLFRESYQGLVHEESVRNMTKLMAYARARSVFEGIPHRIQFDTQRRSYWLEIEEVKEDRVTFVKTRDRYGQIVRLPRHVEIQTDSSEITFYPNGRATEASLTLHTKEKNFEIWVDPILGQAQISGTPR